MQFRGSGQRDSRRRRVLLDDRDELNNGSNNERGEKSNGTEQGDQVIRPYSALARRMAQPRTVDILPKRKRWIFGITTSLVLIIGSAGWLHSELANSESENSSLHEQVIQLLEGSATWFGSTLLLASSVMCIQIFWIRRHKSSDYRGTYQVWIWLAGLFLLASIGFTANAAELVNLVALDVLGLNSPFEAIPWSIWCLIGLLLLVSARMWFELRTSWLANCSMLAGVGLLVVTSLLRTGSIPIEPPSVAFIETSAVESSELAEFAPVETPTAQTASLKVMGQFAPSTVALMAELVAFICLFQSLLFQYREVDVQANHRYHLKPLVAATPKRSKRRKTKKPSDSETDDADANSNQDNKVERVTKTVEIPIRSKASKRRSEPVKEEESLETEKVDTSTKQKSKSARPKLKIATRNEPEEQLDDSQPEEDLSTISMSKSQRRKLRKQAKRTERRAA